MRKLGPAFAARRDDDGGNNGRAVMHRGVRREIDAIRLFNLDSSRPQSVHEFRKANCIFANIHQTTFPGRTKRCDITQHSKPDTILRLIDSVGLVNFSQVAIQLGAFPLFMPRRGMNRGEGRRKPGAGREELGEDVEFVSAPFGGGVEVGANDGEVGESLQCSPRSAGGSLLYFHWPQRSVG
jgi:hypothetical protein